MGHAGRAACRLHFESLFEPFVSVPETHASPEENGHDGDVHEVDEVGLDEFANGRRTPTNADVQSSGGLSRDLQGSDRAGVDEIEGRSALRLEGWVGEVGEHEDGSVKRWVVAPPALPTVVDPGASLGSELVTAGDLGSDPRRPIAGKEIVDTRGRLNGELHVNADSARAVACAYLVAWVRKGLTSMITLHRTSVRPAEGRRPHRGENHGSERNLLRRPCPRWPHVSGRPPIWCPPSIEMVWAVI